MKRRAENEGDPGGSMSNFRRGKEESSNVTDGDQIPVVQSTELHFTVHINTTELTRL
jgi:hypothetical protein